MKVTLSTTGEPERFIGEIDHDRKLFVKKVRLSEHLFKKLDAWGMDAQYFNDVLLPGGYTIMVYEEEEDLWYGAPAQIIKDKGTFLHFKNGPVDHRAQVFLPRIHWKKQRLGK